MKQHSRTVRGLALGAVSVLAVVSIAGCGGDSGRPAGEGAGSAAAGSEAHNDADVRFATEMIPHHAQALVMADLTTGRPLGGELTALVDAIRAEQTPEIELMADWLQEWGEPVPETVRDHAHAGHGGEMPEMTGMMSEEELAELEDASPAEFEELWLTMMVEHHEGAVTMAEAELADGSFEPALDLAEGITASQSEEIEQMREMLGE